MAKRFLNAGFGHPLGRRNLRWIDRHGFDGIRQDIPWWMPRYERQALLTEIAEREMGTVLVIGGWLAWESGEIVDRRHKIAKLPPEEIADFAAVVAKDVDEVGLIESTYFEIGNEQEMVDYTTNNPEVYASWITKAARCIWDTYPSAKVCGGSTPGPLYPKRLKWIRRVIENIPPEVILTAHPYRTHTTPSDVDQSYMLTKYLSMVMEYGRRHAVSEIGWHTAPFKVGTWPCRERKQWTDAEVARFAMQEVLFWESEGAEFVVWFQLNDGPNPNNPEDRFGIRYQDGRGPKPVALQFKEMSI